MTYTQPFTLLFLLIAFVGVIRFQRSRSKVSLRLALGGLAALLALTWPPAVAVAAYPLTAWYPRQARPSGDVEAIVVLSGGISPPRTVRPYSLAGRDTYLRVEHAAWLFHNWKPLPIIVSGGSQAGEESAASVMREMLIRDGVPASMIRTEDQSRSTYENAVQSARILRGIGFHRVALVVDADSMLRAEKCFRKQGLSVAPAPCFFWNIRWSAEDLLPGWPGIYRGEIVAHEALGLLWYWVNGRI